jgi:hypothetical protein
MLSSNPLSLSLDMTIQKSTSVAAAAHESGGLETQLSSSPMRSAESSSLEHNDSKVCLFFFHEEGPVGYSIYTIDVGAIGGHENMGSLEKPTQTLTPLIELSSVDYPKGMSAFAVGSRIYLIGGDVVPRRRRKYGKNTLALSDIVYVCDTSSRPLSFVPEGRMNGGKTRPFVIPVNGMFYILSHIQPDMEFNKKNAFFESFDPNTNKWSTLPNPPFYDFEVARTGTSVGRSALVVSYTVVGSMIVFFTLAKSFLYAFHINECKWERFEISRRQYSRFPFKRDSVLISDSVWATAGYPPTSSHLVPELGFIKRGVEDLEILPFDSPCLAYDALHHLLDLENGWFCLVKAGRDAFADSGGKQAVLATVFRLVEKRKDEFHLYEVYPWLAHEGPPLLEKCFPDPEKIGGETAVLRAEEVRCSLFNVAVDVNHFHE